ncbi:hypothetical protein B9479_007623 [Cryptococcus floricola]|uniref:Nucleolar protein 12 n=1 Tax=Cryptococcus floricola TaxID=2591691 RepID=A0A5D3ANT7_9TREE|nr:hypothetical protein B9479_007623 [Cryptococcus floricola]
MAKSAAAKGKAPIKDKNNKRKRDTEEKAQEQAPASLFGGVKDAELDDIFAKSSAFAQPATSAPVASSSKAHLQETSAPVAKKGKKSAPAPAPEPEPESESESEDEVDEEAQDISDDDDAMSNAATLSELDEEEEDEDEDEDEDDKVALEAAKAAQEARKAKKAKAEKFVPQEESAADKNRRTVFAILNQLKAHIKSFVPTAKIESVRFRSVAFATPTDSVPTEDPEKDAISRAKREKLRTAAWRKKDDKDDEAVDEHKVFIDAKGKRKVAFIKKDFHPDIDSCNAYVVFGHPHPDRSDNVAPVMNPYDAATEVISSANASTFLSRTLRFDTVRLPSSVGLASATNALSKRDAWLPSNADPKKSLFVGGLDYAAKEEDLRVYFEELVKAERGQNNELGKWVTGVRIVRDKETQLGKGFAYVHFSDRESVDEVLAMDKDKIKFAKRKLRVQPCKTLPSSNTLNNTIKKLGSAAAKDGKAKKASKPRVKAGAVPKGDPALGDKLKDLSKEERKTFKSADADRQARRLAKKKAKNATERDMSKGKVKVTLTKGEREKTSAARKGVAKKGKKRTPAAIAKMKGSRT